MIDDGPWILATARKVWESRVTTVFPYQGHYAADPETLANHSRGDMQTNCIADIVEQDFYDQLKQ
jgi:hypothetical protein